MLQLFHAYFLAKSGFDTAENEPSKNLQNFANNGKNLLIWIRLDTCCEVAPHVAADGAGFPLLAAASQTTDQARQQAGPARIRPGNKQDQRISPVKILTF